MANTVQPARPKKPKPLYGSGPVIRLRCCVCGTLIRESKARESVVNATQLKAWCEEHMPQLEN